MLCIADKTLDSPSSHRHHSSQPMVEKSTAPAVMTLDENRKHFAPADNDAILEPLIAAVRPAVEYIWASQRKLFQPALRRLLGTRALGTTTNAQRSLTPAGCSIPSKPRSRRTQPRAVIRDIVLFHRAGRPGIARPGEVAAQEAARRADYQPRTGSPCRRWKT